MASSDFQSICSQLEAEHERIVTGLQAQIVQLQERLGDITEVGSPEGQLKTSPFTDDMALVVSEKSVNSATPKLEKSSSSTDLGIGGETEETDSEDEDQTNEERWAISMLFPKWLECCGFSGSCLGDWLIWWEQCQEPERSGVLQRFIESKAFQTFILGVILTNTVFIITMTDSDMHRSLTTHSVGCTLSGLALAGDLIFASIYIIELFLKLGVHRLYFFTHGDWKWNVFDAFLVVTVVINFIVDRAGSSACGEQSSMAFLRALRVLKSARVLRMLRVVRFVQELRLMLDCIVNSILHLFWCVILIGMMLLMFALYLMQGLKSQAATATDNTMIAERFSTVAQTMVSLLMATTGGTDWSDQYDFMVEAGLSLQVAYLVYISFFTMVAWNIVMSSFVEKASRLGVADVEAQCMEKYRQQRAHVKELGKMLRYKMDADQDGTVSLEEFKGHIHDKDLATFCLARDINITDVDLFFHMLAANGTTEVDINTFAKSIVRLRGNASAIDMQSLHFDLRKMQDDLQKIEYQTQSVEKETLRREANVETNLLQLRYAIECHGKLAGLPCSPQPELFTM